MRNWGSKKPDFANNSSLGPFFDDFWPFWAIFKVTAHYRVFF